MKKEKEFFAGNPYWGMKVDQETLSTVSNNIASEFKLDKQAFLDLFEKNTP